MAIASNPASVEAREAQRHAIDIPAGTIGDALAELSREAGISIGTDGVLPPLRAHAVKGRLTVEQALAHLLAGTGYVAWQVGPTAWRIERAPAAPAVRPAPAALAPAVAPPIVVSASKRGATLLDLPMAAAIVDAGNAGPLRPGAASGTADVASEIEGMTLAGLGPGRNRMFLRGISDSAFNGESQSTVAVVLDDARLTYAAPDPDIALVDMERVEVLKGPQGALYGAGTLGGIYHLVTRKADLSETTLSLSAGGEKVAQGGAGYDLSAVANLPLVSDVAGLRLVGYRRERPGWVDTGDRSDGNSDRLAGLRAGLGVDAGGGWRLDLTGFAQWLEARDSQYVYAPGARSRPAQIAEPHDNDLRHVSARLARESGGMAIVLSSAMTWHEVGDTYDATTGADGFGLADPQSLAIVRNYRVWDSEARVSGAMGSWSWVAGLSAIQARQHGLSTLSGLAGELAVDEDHRTSTDLAAFGDVTVPLGSGFAFDAGARLFHATMGETRALPSGTVTRDEARTGVTPSLALSWHPSARQFAFLRYGSAFRQGGLEIGSSGEPERLKADELMTLEAGWRQQVAGEGMLELGAYYSRWQDMQSDMLQPDGLVETANAGTAQILGLEGSLALPLGQAWSLSLGASLQRARLVRNGLGIELEDRRLPVVPDYVLRGALEHSFRLAGGKASLRAKLRYVGPSRLSFDPALDRAMGGYLESGAEGRVDWGDFRLSLSLDNLLGGSADTFAFGNPLRVFAQPQYTPQRPFSALLSASLAF